jgi:class 3 adenylate cyclase
MEIPETRYARTADGVHIGYQVLGEGAIDLVFVPWDYSNIEASWDLRPYASFVRKLGARARILLFDRRGSGTSDRAAGDQTVTIEARMDDIRAVMDAAGSTQACLFSFESGAKVSFVFGATYPERTSGMIVFGGTVAGRWAPDYPWGWTDDEWDAWFDRVEREWGSPGFIKDLNAWLSPSFPADADYLRTLGRMLRLAASPGDAVARDRGERDTDVRHVLASIQVPTLVLHRSGDRVEPVEQGRYIAEHVPGARLMELEGDDHFWPMDDIVPHIASFLDSIRAEKAVFDRVLATVLFTDIVDSTERAATMGDRAWREMLVRHHTTVRAMLGRYRGREVDTAGDAFFATFDGPARAIRCAAAISEAVRTLGIEIRAGLHTGEVELEGNEVRGIAVHIGARVGALAGPSEVLVSQTVKDLVAGSGLTFEDAGEHDMKGIPDRWRLYRVTA